MPVMAIVHRRACHADARARVTGALGVDTGGAIAAQHLHPQALRGMAFGLHGLRCGP